MHAKDVHGWGPPFRHRAIGQWALSSEHAELWLVETTPSVIGNLFTLAIIDVGEHLAPADVC